MDKFRTMLKDANSSIKEKGKPLIDINGDIIGYSMEGWRVENCTEVWAVRNAIFGGAKVDNIILRTIEHESGDFAELCKNCNITFEEFINSGRIIED